MITRFEIIRLSEIDLLIFEKKIKMSLLTVGSVAFDAIETPFGKTDKIVGGAGTYISLASSFFVENQNIISAM